LFGAPENFTTPARPDPTPTYWGSKGELPQLIVLFEVFWDSVWKCKKMKFQMDPRSLKTVQKSVLMTVFKPFGTQHRQVVPRGA